MKRFDLKYYLDKLPKDVLNNISLNEEFVGQDTKVEYIYPKCKCKIITTLKLVNKFKNFEECNRCRTRVSLQSFLRRINFPIVLLEDYHGGQTRCSMTHSACGHVYETTLNRMVKKVRADFCSSCASRDDLNNVLSRLPFDIAKSITLTEEYIGNKTNVKVKFRCGCIQVEKIVDLLCRKTFYCNMCNKKKTFDNHYAKIPNKYKSLIIVNGEMDGFNTKVIYKSPCGHDSHTIIGELSDRKNFNRCTRCSYLSINKYLQRLKNIEVNVVEDNGRFSRVSFKCLGCDSISEVLLSTLLKSEGKYCRKCYHGKNDDDLSAFLSEYLYDIVISTDEQSKYSASRGKFVTACCKKCKAQISGNYFSISAYYRYYKKQQCKSCAPKNITQLDIFNFVKTISNNVKYNDRSVISGKKNQEIDIYCPDERFAIEYNGLYWHSEACGKSKNYHTNKSLMCANLNITLLHIWGDLYLKSSSIYRSIIKVKLGVIDNKVSARKTIVKELTKKEIDCFFTNNHINGNVGCLTGWGLFYEGKLVQAVSVRKVNSQNKKYFGYLEIARSASLMDHLIVGGESKLLSTVEKYAVKNGYSGILNYVSMEFGGIPKNKWKFEYVGMTDCSYCYTDGVKRIARQKLQKRKPGQSEKDLASELGLIRVNLTPNFIYVLSFK